MKAIRYAEAFAQGADTSSQGLNSFFTYQVQKSFSASADTHEACE
jgi:hypothetical protein